MADVLGYLQSKAITLKPAGARNVHTACFFCGEDPSRRGRLYINIDPDAEVPGLFQCKLCDKTGSLVALKRHFGDQATETELDSATRAEILSAAAAYYHDKLLDFAEVLAYLKSPERGLTLETISKHEIGYAPMDFGDIAQPPRRPRLLYRHLRDRFESRDILATGLCQEVDGRIADALAGMITIPYHVAGQVVAIRGRTWPQTDDDWATWTGPRYTPSPAKYKTCAGTASRLFNTDATWGSKEIILTEGEFDALVLEQEGYAAVGVPGATAWQDAWDDYLSGAKRVFIVFDRDAAGDAAATKLAERLGAKARRVHLSESGIKCDPTQWFARDGHTQDEFEDLLVRARRGALLITVREAIEEFAAVQSQPGLKFGWEYLDTLLHPGLQAGQLMLVLAKTGTGKTIFLLNLMQRIRMAPEQKDLRFLFVSLEQTRGEWWDRARRMHRFYNLDTDEEDAARFWENNLLIVDRNRVTEPQLHSVLDDYEHELGGAPDAVFVDYLGYFSRGFRGEAYQRTSDAVMTLKAIAKERRIPMIVPHQVSRVGVDGQEFGADAARDSGVIEETADFLLTMWSPDNLLGREEEEKTGQVHLRIAKSRHGGRGRLLNMQFAPISLVMVPDDDPLCARARREFNWKEAGDSWEKTVYRHRTGFEGHLADNAFFPGGGWR